MNAENMIKRLSALGTQIKGLIVSPTTCWEAIAQDDATPSKILSEKVIPLIALGVICTVVGFQVFGISMGPLGTWRPPLVSFTVSKLVAGLVTVVQIYVAAWIALKLTNFFQGSATQQKAFSLVAHSMLPALAASILSLYPPLALLGLVLVVLSIRAFYLGVPKMTTVPESQKLGYTASFVVSMLLVVIVLTFATARLIANPTPGL